LRNCGQCVIPSISRNVLIPSHNVSAVLRSNLYLFAFQQIQISLFLGKEPYLIKYQPQSKGYNYKRGRRQRGR
jgi:hypothetical protein